MKLCPHCMKMKPLNEFGNNRFREDGRTKWCLQCLAAGRAPRQPKEVPK